MELKYNLYNRKSVNYILIQYLLVVRNNFKSKPGFFKILIRSYFEILIQGFLEVNILFLFCISK